MRIRHKSLRALQGRDPPAGLPAGLVLRLRCILSRLREATHTAVATPGFRLLPLKCGRADHRSAHVTGNWRVVFRFEDGAVVDMDLIDYH